MEGNNIKGAVVLSGAAAFLLLQYAPFSSFTYLASFGIWLHHFTWWQVWLGLFIVTFLHEPIFTIISNLGQTGVMLGGNITLTLRDYLAKMKLMNFWKKKKAGIHGDADFMGWWEQWRYYFNTRNTGWAVGKNALPDGTAKGEDITLGGVLALGGMGTGKTAAIIITSIFRFLLTGEKNLFINDPSGKIYKETSGMAAGAGYKVYRLSTLKETVQQSLRFNPLMWCESVSDVAMLAEKIVAMQQGDTTSSTSQFFMSRAKILVTAILVATWKQTPEYRNLPNAFRLLLHYASDREVFAKAIETALAEEDNLRLQWCGLNAKGVNEKELGSVISTGETALAFAGDPTMAYILSGNEFDLNALRDEKMIFYNQFSETNTYFTPINALLLSYCFDRCSSGEEAKDANYRGIRFLLDELFCLPYLSGLSRFLANSRKYDAASCLVFQGLNQLYVKYKSHAKAILDGVQTRVFFRGLDPKYYEDLQKVMGARTVEDEDGRKYQKQLMSVDKMEQMGKYEAIIKMPSLPPIKAKFQRYYQITLFKRLAQIAPFEQPIRDISDVAYLPFDESIEDDIETKIVTKQKQTSDELGTNQDVGHESDSDLQG